MPISAPQVVYEDTDLLVVLKPPALHTVKLPHTKGEDSLACWLEKTYPECLKASANTADCGICHRLDYETSGLVLAAKNTETYAAMREMLSGDNEHKRIEKKYICITESLPTGAAHAVSYFYNRYKRSKKYQF